jgi:hypothetical protein
VELVKFDQVNSKGQKFFAGAQPTGQDKVRHDGNQFFYREIKCQTRPGSGVPDGPATIGDLKTIGGGTVTIGPAPTIKVTRRGAKK